MIGHPRRAVLLLLSLAIVINLLTFSVLPDYWKGPFRPTMQRVASGFSTRRPMPRHRESCASQANRGLSHNFSAAASDRSNFSNGEHFLIFGHQSGTSSSGKAASRVTWDRPALRAPRLDSLWDVWHLNFTLNKMTICDVASSGNRSVFAVVVVVSAPVNREERVAIRETWGRALPSDVRLLFFVGRALINGTAQQPTLLLEEDSLYGDIVQADFEDHYTNLTLKSVLVLRWVTTHCPAARFVVKVDDDVFVNVDNFRRTLQRHSGLRGRIFGHLAHFWRPVRDRSSPYYVAEAAWTASIYPDFVAGPAYVITLDAVTRLLAQVSSVPFFYLEDVYVTGICAEKAGIQRLNHRGFCNKKYPINPCIFHRLVTFHHLGVQEMRAAWDILHRYSADDGGCYRKECTSQWFGLCFAKGEVPVDYYPTLAAKEKKKINRAG